MCYIYVCTYVHLFRQSPYVTEILVSNWLNASQGYMCEIWVAEENICLFIYTNVNNCNAFASGIINCCTVN